MRTVPNVSLARIAGTPEVYLVVGGCKLHITSPSDFRSLGLRPERILDVDPRALWHLQEKSLQASPATRASDVFVAPDSQCGYERHPIAVGIHSPWSKTKNRQTDLSVLRRDVLIAGWLTKHYDSDLVVPYVHDEGMGIEDVFYDIHLDADFFLRMYGPDGVSVALNQAVCPGNPSHGAPALPFRDRSEDARDAVTLNSWVMPGTGSCPRIHVELNAWHQVGHTWGFFERHDKIGFVGYGPPPEGWRSYLPQDPDSHFPFDPLNPDGIGALHENDYVLIRGTLWQDTAHNGGAGPWEWGPTLHHTAELEMHPPDWVVRLAGPAPNARLSWANIDFITGGLVRDAQTHVTIRPDNEYSQGLIPSGPYRTFKVRYVDWLRDTRVSNTSPTTQHIDRLVDQIDYRLEHHAATSHPNAYKEAVTVAWSEVDRRDEVGNGLAWLDDALPSGATETSGDEGWLWVGYLGELAYRPRPFNGTLAHLSPRANQHHGHGFIGALPMHIGEGDTLFAMVFLHPEYPPDEIVLGWFSDGWNARASWGADKLGIPPGVHWHHDERLPISGEWVRLEIPGTALSLQNKSMTGMRFDCWNGEALWDYAGISRAS